MARPRKQAFEAVMSELGRQIEAMVAEGVARGVEAGLARAGAGRVPGRRGRPPGAARPCGVPGCERASAAKGLCQNHYAKARRLKMGLEKLSTRELETLSQDLRGQR